MSRSDRKPHGLADGSSFRESWVLSGSMIGWGDDVVARCDAVVFLTLDSAERLRRLEARGHARYEAGCP